MSRYRYNVAQALAEILKDDLENEDSDNQDNSIESDDEASDGENVVQHEDETSERVDDVFGVNDIRPTLVNEGDANNSDYAGDSDDSNATVEYDVGGMDQESAVTNPESNGEESNDDNDYMLSRCRKISWRRHPLPVSRQPLRNILTETEGLPDGIQFDSIAEAFRLFFNDDMVRHILLYTNMHAREIKEKSDSFRWEKDLTEEEFFAFLGLLILSGVQKSKNQCLSELWHDQWGLAVFPATMSINQFRNIQRALRYDDKNTRDQRIVDSGNQGAAVQEIMDIFVKSCRRSYRCGPSVTIDEQLVSFHGRCRFRMYIPSKPGKYGLKMWVMADSEKFYCADAQLYCGRVGNNPDVGQGKRVVLDLCKNIEGTGRNVTTDNFFTSYELAKELNNRRLSLVGTIRGNRKEVPKEMLPDSSKEVFSSLFGFSRDGATMVSYVPKRKKAVVLLSTQHRDNAVSTDGKCKPEIIPLLQPDEERRGCAGQARSTYSCKRATRRWTCLCFTT